MQIRPDVKRKYDKAIELMNQGRTLNSAAIEAGTWPQLLRKYLQRERPELAAKYPSRGTKKRGPKMTKSLHETIVVQNSPVKDLVYFVSGPADVISKILGTLQ